MVSVCNCIDVGHRICLSLPLCCSIIKILFLYCFVFLSAIFSSFRHHKLQAQAKEVLKAVREKAKLPASVLPAEDDDGSEQASGARVNLAINKLQLQYTIDGGVRHYPTGI